MDTNTRAFLKALQHPDFYPHPVSQIEMIETHISWVFLTGDWVYKIKKPVNLGFLDFSTLEKRYFYCQEELRLNKRLAVDYYDSVVSITGSMQAPVLGGSGEVFEYAVKMRQFPQQSQLDRKLEKGQLTLADMSRLAQKIADFHQSIPQAGNDVAFGDLAHVHQPVTDCYQTILNIISAKNDVQQVNQLQQWSDDAFKQLQTVFLQRKSSGFVRECHGDLHLRNIAIDDQQVIVFDCIEFKADFRWVDVMSEIAFLIMDLDDHGKTDLAYRFLNDYLEITGDYQGLVVLRYYLVYRAIVRAMVSAIRMGQGDLSKTEYDKEQKTFREYLQLAERYTHPKSTALLLTCGLSGSGKTYLAKSIAPCIPAIHIRSDIERKRMFTHNHTQQKSSGIQQGIYKAEATEKTYARLLELAETLLNANFHVLIDATFLKKQQRQVFVEKAQTIGRPFLILYAKATTEVMQQRILQRQAANTDASDADLNVLQYQLKNQEALTVDEMDYVLMVDTNDELNIDTVVSQIKAELSQEETLPEMT